MKNREDAYKVIIAGSRNIEDYDYLCAVCDLVLEDYNQVEVVCGFAKGVDKMGLRYAKERGYYWRIMKAAWDDIEGKPDHEIKFSKRGKPYWIKAGLVRNDSMARYADGLISIWDGKSTGSANMIKVAKQLRLDLHLFKYDKK